MRPLPSLTAAICTHAGSGRIEQALQSILDQADPPSEILVVDNAPPDGRTAELVRSRFPEVRYLVEPTPGLDFARNTVLEHAVHDVVAYLDDDAVAGPEWTARVRRAFGDNPRLVACSCRVTALRLDTEARRMFEANGGLDRGPDSVLLPRDSQQTLNGARGSMVAWVTRIAVGCGMAVDRNEARALGGFDTALDLGSALPGGGDCDFMWRAVAAGHDVEYLPDAVIRHDHRESLDAATRQVIGHQRALVALLTKVVRESSGADRRAALVFLGWRLVKPGLRIGKRLLGDDPLPASILVRMWWGCWAGLVAYPIAQRTARRRLHESRPALLQPTER